MSESAPSVEQQAILIIIPAALNTAAPKPESAYAMVRGVRRNHRRQNVDMASCKQLSAVLKGLTKACIMEHGAEALLPYADRRFTHDSTAFLQSRSGRIITTKGLPGEYFLNPTRWCRTW